MIARNKEQSTYESRLDLAPAPLLRLPVELHVEVLSYMTGPRGAMTRLQLRRVNRYFHHLLSPTAAEDHSLLASTDWARSKSLLICCECKLLRHRNKFLYMYWRKRSDGTMLWSNNAQKCCYDCKFAASDGTFQCYPKTFSRCDSTLKCAGCDGATDEGGYNGKFYCKTCCEGEVWKSRNQVPISRNEPFSTASKVCGR